MTLIVDASMVVAGLIDDGDEGKWAEGLLADNILAAPSLVQIEAANILRRAQLAGEITADSASLAHHDLLDLKIELFTYEPFSERTWELRGNVSMYDAWYVSIAECLDAPLATLDRRLTRAPGPRCRFVTPES